MNIAIAVFLGLGLACYGLYSSLHYYGKSMKYTDAQMIAYFVITIGSFLGFGWSISTFGIAVDSYEIQVYGMIPQVICYFLLAFTSTFYDYGQEFIRSCKDGSPKYYYWIPSIVILVLFIAAMKSGNTPIQYY